MGSIATARLTEPPEHAAGAFLRESYPADAQSLPEARQAIGEFAAAAGVAGAQLDAVRLAASEAITNIVQYAYPWRTGHIYITARVAGDELWILIADNGCGIHAGRDSEGLGLGLALISHVTDGFSVVERSSGGTELRLRFALSPAGQVEGSAARRRSARKCRLST
jgi:anti-sigma regulatory factor (Ser/Thr protein kinase)